MAMASTCSTRLTAINFLFSTKQLKVKVIRLKNLVEHRFLIALINVSIDPVKEVALNTTDIEKTQQYWHSLLNMKVLEKSDSSLALTYGENQASLAFKKVNVAIDRKTAYGRIAFAVPYEIQPVIEKIVKENNQPILKDLVTLPTPGKADVRVIILSDPNQLEICFVDEEGFSQLSQFDPKGDADLEKYIKKDPFQ